MGALAASAEAQRLGRYAVPIRLGLRRGYRCKRMSHSETLLSLAAALVTVAIGEATRGFDSGVSTDAIPEPRFGGQLKSCHQCCAIIEFANQIEEAIS